MIRRIALAIAGLALAGCGLTTSSHNAATPADSPGSSGGNGGIFATTPAPAPAPSANPKGTYTGSCDYTLSVYGNDHLVGEIDLQNTGNIGTVNRTRITWPQEGYSPITARKTVRVPAGSSKSVRFHIPIPADSNVIDLLQSWQDNHQMKDGCTYHVSIIDVYGKPQ